LILLPGLDGTEIFFRPMLAALPPWIEPVVVTFPTSGPNDYASLLDLVQSAIPETRDFYVLGWSFSGPLALMLAANDPRVRGVILCASFVRPPLRGLTWLRPVAKTPVISAVRLGRRVPLLLSRQTTDLLWLDKAATWARVPSSALAARTRAIARLDATECLRACSRPVLYLAGSRDKVVPRRNAEEVLRESRSAKLVTIEGRHLALYTNPEAAVEAIVEFISEGNERF
jgi:pimeloyl-[acyl-carrier protein] methyl ester esterase